MRQALKIVDIHVKKGQSLNHATLRRIFEGLTNKEKAQMTDYIIFKYNFLDYFRLSNIYGTFDKMLLAIETNAGAEHDLEDDCGDHSYYQRMLRETAKTKYNGIHPDALSRASRTELAQHLLRTVHPPRAQLRKFLHLS